MEFINIQKPRTVLFIVGLLLGLILLLWFGDPALIVNGILLGFVFALGAIGISLIYGILKFGHFAIGEYK